MTPIIISTAFQKGCLSSHLIVSKILILISPFIYIILCFTEIINKIVRTIKILARLSHTVFINIIFYSSVLYQSVKHLTEREWIIAGGDFNGLLQCDHSLWLLFVRFHLCYTDIVHDKRIDVQAMFCIVDIKEGVISVESW